MSFPFTRQHDAMDCGPACLRMIAEFHGRKYTLQSLREKTWMSREGVSMQGISEAAEQIGFRTLGVSVSYEKLKELQLPCILHWNQNHFVVLYKINNSNNSPFIKRGAGGEVRVADPAHGLVKYTKEEFLKGWKQNITSGESLGIALLLETTPDFYDSKSDKEHKKGFGFLFNYLSGYKKLIIQLFFGVLLGSLLQLIFPFLTQSLVDFGIHHHDLKFIYIILAAQLMLFFSRTVVDFIRGWILLHIGARINISLVSDFLIKLMKLPIAFFDTKMIGDLLQRISDNQRIENFLTGATLNILFSVVNFLVFGAVLAFYNIGVFALFLTGSILYTAWIIIFLKKRRDLDFKRFDRMRDNQNSLYQLITGMQEIKLHNSERQKRWEWERIQAKLYKINMQSLRLSQSQQAGAVFINELKNIAITFLAAKSVMDGHMTLGMMLSVQYIIGQLNSPLDQMIGFIHTAQDAKISLERLSEIHNREDEEQDVSEKIQDLPLDKSIYFNNVSFRYSGPSSDEVLKNIILTIPQGKITAIVGTSGSGKTTLLKLLLNFYLPVKGDIKVGGSHLFSISSKLWRSKCGVVMQDGFIFSDTIAKNIGVGEERINREKLFRSAETANIREFIDTLPHGFNTKIGSDGHGLSQGQKQRILIARAVYKDPEYIFLDEATNSLDANNEMVIMKNMDEFFQGRTVVVVAHRLSTVKNADQIVVLEKGRIVELGTHQELTRQRLNYYNLVKNQLELGN